MYFSFFLSWHTTKMTPQSRATMIITIMAGTSTMGSISTTGVLRASEAENTLPSTVDYHVCYTHTGTTAGVLKQISKVVWVPWLDILSSDLSLCLPLQFKPFLPSRYPTAQLQAKLPMVLLHICSHPPFAVSHSLMSMEQENMPLYIALCRDIYWSHNYNSHVLYSSVYAHNQSCSMWKKLTTCAVKSIPFKAIYACTAEASTCVSAVGIGVTCMNPQFTLINICRWYQITHLVKLNRMTHNAYSDILIDNF